MNFPLTNIREPEPQTPFRATIYCLLLLPSEKKTRCLYVGCTSSPLAQRLRSHRAQALLNIESCYGIHTYMLEQGVHNFTIRALEVLDHCVNRNQLKKMEEQWRSYLNPVFNRKRAFVEDDAEEVPPFLDYVTPIDQVPCTCREEEKKSSEKAP